jgi:hypothetical protein
MTPTRKAARRRPRPSTESAVYDGSRFCGTIMPKAGAFVARIASGKSIGKFDKENDAQRAIAAAARAEFATQSPKRPVDTFSWKPNELVIGQRRGDAPSKRRAPSAPTEISGSQP